MNGPEHYKRAEYLAALSIQQRERETENDPAPLSVLTMAQAQVHATLALAAATAGYRTTWTDPSFNTTSTYVEGEWTEAFA